jgi:hypothetical protein
LAQIAESEGIHPDVYANGGLAGTFGEAAQ